MEITGILLLTIALLVILGWRGFRIFGDVLRIMLALVAWLVFLATFLWIPKDPFHPSLNGSSFAMECLPGFGAMLYDHNITWRREVSLERARARKEGRQPQTLRFSWRPFFRQLFTHPALRSNLD
ncbi:MAG: hypothetical protein JWN64_248 [Parcubacteria group bacterium]|nr:hypothetical protein [Parcubacteria group bacterium]